jgi:hypothetical protein
MLEGLTPVPDDTWEKMANFFSVAKHASLLQQSVEKKSFITGHR